MIPTLRQQEALKRLAESHDSDIILSFYKDVIKHYADVRAMREVTIEELRARQLACDILEVELIARISRLGNIISTKTQEEYE